MIGAYESTSLWADHTPSDIGSSAWVSSHGHRHSAIGMISPVEFENRFTQTTEAA